MDVNATGISGKVSAHYPGRSALCLYSVPAARRERTESRESGMTAVQKSAEAVVVVDEMTKG